MFTFSLLGRKTTLTVLVTLILGLVLIPGVASAHGRRTVGQYQFVIGFLAEPTFQNQQSGIDLTICNGECKRDAVSGKVTNPVKDVEKTLQAEVINGKEQLPIKLNAVFGKDGSYSGVFFPTRAGDYTFHFWGTVNGDKVDENFTSGKDGFNSVLKSDQLQFPDKLVNVGDLQQQVKEAKDSASAATIFGIGAGLIGLCGLITGIIALVWRGSKVEETEVSKEEDVLELPR